MAGGKEAFERKLEELAALRAASPPENAVGPLQKALKDRSNYLVSKAAALAGELRLIALTPDLLRAFDRFMESPVKTDPQCWAKDAIVKALKDLGHDDPAVFLRGIGHVQMEPAYGRSVDTALTLRGSCALALVACTLDRQTILTRLVDLLADQPPVRIDAIRALGQCPGHDTVLLLRLKALLGDETSEVSGACFDVLLEIAPAESVPFVARFLGAEDPEVQGEAAAALAASLEPSAIEALKNSFAGRAARTGPARPTNQPGTHRGPAEPGSVVRASSSEDIELKMAILRSLSGSRQIAGAEFLLSVIEESTSACAAIAIQSLAAGRFRDDFRERVEASVRDRGIAALIAAFQAAYP